MKTLTKYMGWESQPATMVNMRKPVSAANDASCASTERRGGELSDKEIISLITRA
jgi:hypothetical protein